MTSRKVVVLHPSFCGIFLSFRVTRCSFYGFLARCPGCSGGTRSYVGNQYYGNTWSASGSVRAWTWSHENVAFVENNLDHIGCDHTSTKAPDPIRTPKRSEERRVGKEYRSPPGKSS